MSKREAGLPDKQQPEGPLTREEVLDVSRALFQHYGWNNPGDLVMRNRIQRMRDMALSTLSADKPHRSLIERLRELEKIALIDKPLIAEAIEALSARSAGAPSFAVAHPNKDADLYLCCADGEGTHEFKVCHGYEGVAAFYEAMCGRDADDTLDSLKRTWDDPDEWRNDGAALEIELYCARFYVWKVAAAELAMPGGPLSATEARDAARWRFGVEHGWPTCHWRIYPEKKLLGWQTPSQRPPQGKTFNEDDYPYYESAEAAIDAAMAAAAPGGPNG